jgi:hypothetical protein
VTEEPVICRNEVLTVMGLIGDLTFAVLRLVEIEGWVDLRAKAEAEGKPLAFEPRKSTG